MTDVKFYYSQLADNVNKAVDSPHVATFFNNIHIMISIVHEYNSINTVYKAVPRIFNITTEEILSTEKGVIKYFIREPNSHFYYKEKDAFTKNILNAESLSGLYIADHMAALYDAEVVTYLEKEGELLVDDNSLYEYVIELNAI